MESNDIGCLREWAPLTDVLEKIPAKIQKGIFSADLNVTCIDAVPEFLGIGTDAGIVFWYNRFSGEVQKLRAEVAAPITCVRIVSSVEYMVAAGSKNGQVNVFQIQKEVPPDLNLVAPITKNRPIERYTIRDLHKYPITCCEWSKNGMKLFSGDRHGVVVLTEFDYQTHLSRSVEILNEAYDIVQLSVNQSYLVVSTLYRSIICQRESNGRWRISQIGKKDRKVMSSFGATFLDVSKKSPTIICARPGLRFWISDCNGNVEQTLLFKDAVAAKPVWDIPLLNPGKNPFKILSNFGVVIMYSQDLVITHDECVLYILNLEQLQMEAVAKGFRKIVDIAVCGKEILVLEGHRSLIRISSCPEPPRKTSKIIFNPMLPPPLPVMPILPVEFEAEEDTIIKAEECFELPAIEHIELDVPLQTNLDSPTTQKNKAIIEQNKRIEVFDKFNDMEFEESILFKSGAGRRHKKFGKKNVKKSLTGIVEIGQIVLESSSPNDVESTSNLATDNETPVQTTRHIMLESSSVNDVESTSNLVTNNETPMQTASSEDSSKSLVESEKGGALELTTQGLLMDISYCSGTGTITDSTEQAPIRSLTESHHKSASINDLSKQSLESINLKKSFSDQNNITLQYPVDYTAICEDSKMFTEPELPSITPNATLQSTELDFSNLAKSAFEPSTSSNLFETCEVNKMSRSLQFVQSQPAHVSTSSQTMPNLQIATEYSNIPNLWNVKIERTEESDRFEAHTNDWELL